jgi:monoamine oxidase
MAGIIASRDLSKKGYKVVLLEARDHLRGRTYIDHACGGMLEQGGGYVHGTQLHVWSERARAYQNPIIAIEVFNGLASRGGHVRSSSETFSGLEWSRKL